MHSFHQSRGRILFEVVCALGIAASCVGAWMQTGASALLPAAAIAALYGVVHAFDARRQKPAKPVVPPLSEFEDAAQGDLLTFVPREQEPRADNEPQAAETAVEAEQVEPAAPRKSRAPRAKAPRKGATRRSSASREKVTEPALPKEAEVAVPWPTEEAFHAPLVPLFEPEPFARQQRTVFGRKAG